LKTAAEIYNKGAKTIMSKQKWRPGRGVPKMQDEKNPNSVVQAENIPWLRTKQIMSSAWW